MKNLRKNIELTNYERSIIYPSLTKDEYLKLKVTICKNVRFIILCNIKI